MQGIITGIGFIGTGAIIKHSQEGWVEGLTTSASIWFTAAIGIAVGLGREASAIIGTLMGILLLSFVPHLSRAEGQRGDRNPKLFITRGEGR